MTIQNIFNTYIAQPVYRTIQTVDGFCMRCSAIMMRRFHRYCSLTSTALLIGCGVALASRVSQYSPALGPLTVALGMVPFATCAMTRKMVFQNAIKCEDVVTIKSMIKAGYSAAEQDENGNTSLHFDTTLSKKKAALAIIEELTEEELNRQNVAGNTPLHWAIILPDKEEIALALVDKLSAKSLNVPDTSGKTALYFAIMDGRDDIAKAIIAKLTPEELTSILIHEFASTTLDVPGGNGFSLLHSAILNGPKEVALALIAKLPVEALTKPDEEEDTPLHVALIEAKKEVALALIAKLPVEELTKPGADGDTPLHLASLLTEKDMADALIDKLPSEKLFPQNDDGRTPLHSAIDRGNLALAQKLIDKLPLDALHITDYDGNTPLCLAIRMAYLNVAAALINKLSGSPWLNKPNDEGNTPLHIALDKGHLGLAEILILELPAAQWLNKSNNSGKTPLDLTVEKGFTNLTQALIKKLSHSLHLSILHKEPEIALALIDELSIEEINMRDENGNTPLHLAIIKEQYEIALALIDEMPTEELERPNNDRNTPLHLLILNGQHTSLQESVMDELVRLAFTFDRRMMLEALLDKLPLTPIEGTPFSTLGSANKDGLFPIQLAIQMGDEFASSKLQDKGVSVFFVEPGELEKPKSLEVQASLKYGIGVKKWIEV